MQMPSRARARLLGSILLGAAALGALGGCGSETVGDSDDSCTHRLEFRSDAYEDHPGVEVVAGPKVGSASQLSCSDGGERSSPEQFDAFEAKGLDPSLGILVDVFGSGLALYTLDDPTPAQRKEIDSFAAPVG